MEHLTNLKPGIFTVIGVIGGTFTSLLGGWDTGLQTLIIFMALDYLTGLLVAGVWKNSNKSSDGRLESYAGWKGIIKKGMTLAIVLIGAQLDIVMNTEIVRNAVIIAFLVNEVISIAENAKCMGIDVPDALLNAIDNLKSKK